MEMNLSETAFLSPSSSSSSSSSSTSSSNSTSESRDCWSQDDTFDLRWFTPTVEVDLCGHATLAAAHVLFHERGNGSSALHFNTRSGELVATRTGEGAIELDFPENRPDLVGSLDEVAERAAPAAAAVWEAICEETRRGGGGDVVSGSDLELHPTAGAAYSSRTGKLVLRLGDDTPPAALESLCAPSSALLAATARIDESTGGGGKVQGVAVTLLGGGAGDDSVDFCSRYFNPWWGIPEDPVNGSSHTVLVGFWEECGVVVVAAAGQGGGREERKASSSGSGLLLRARVCSARGGELGVRATGGRVFLSGTAATSVEGKLRMC